MVLSARKEAKGVEIAQRTDSNTLRPLACMQCPISGHHRGNGLRLTSLQLQLSGPPLHAPMRPLPRCRAALPDYRRRHLNVFKRSERKLIRWTAAPSFTLALTSVSIFLDS
jgi:hypothetical protein